ncbi:MAG: tRNA lysidine(34) synthetase TilS [Candidatus Muirbacterium halophilum]|nr:tRNA lysidine(34) synthetase TilS [Candidatus Muirbacterium halophilum]MCK9475348.1 tRNA lysidine(34) synthetase TilS [Candidatus Muirbacterium halophilum]
MDILKKQIDYIVENKIIVCEKDKIVLGLSGGPDSVFLLLVLNELKKHYGLEFVATHINYNLRGHYSKEDRMFCEKLCEEFGIKLYILDTTIKENTSIQEKARNIRFDYYRLVLKDLKYNLIAIGHNLDDNIETVLHNLIRGCGLNGLKGLDEISKDIVRPILSIPKNEISTYLDKNSISYRKDLSNEKNCYTRNKIRNNIVKEILSINPSFYNVFNSFSQNIRINQNFVRINAFDYIEKNIISYDEGKYLIVKNKLFNNEDFDNIYINFILKDYLNIEEGVYSSNIREILKIVKSSGGKHTIIKNFIVLNDYNRIIFLKKECFDLYFPDFKDSIIFEGNNSVNVKFEKTKKYGNSTNELNINKDEIKWPIVLRHRKNGDRIGTDTLLKKKLIDKKINRVLRDRIPVFEDSNKIIIWVPGIYKKKFKNLNTKIIYTGRMFWIKTEN